METSTLIVFIIIQAVFLGIILFFVKKKLTDEKGNTPSSLVLLQQQMQDVRNALDVKLGESHKATQYQFQESAKIIRDVTEKLTRLDETNKQIVSFADQLQSLQDILKNPKQRGILGEYYLETLLKNVLPPGSYEMQCNLGKNDDGNDLIVDAAVKVKDKIIPIDSKFSLENYNRLIEAKDSSEKERLEKLFINDLKNRILETSKYIRPERNTTEFAFMFIPHEAIYYDLLINKVGAITEETENLLQRAAGKYKVIIVSPTSFLAYLQTVLQGLKALQIEESAKDIRKRVDELGKHLAGYQQHMDRIGTHLGTTVNAYNAASKEFMKVDKDILRITQTAPGLKLESVEKPQQKEDE